MEKIGADFGEGFRNGFKGTLEQIGVDSGDDTDKAVFWAENKRYDMTHLQTMTPNELRELHGIKPIMKGPQDRKGTIRKRCAYCGTVSDRDYGTCEQCGAPL